MIKPTKTIDDIKGHIRGLVASYRERPEFCYINDEAQAALDAYEDAADDLENLLKMLDQMTAGE